MRDTNPFSIIRPHRSIVLEEIDETVENHIEEQSQNGPEAEPANRSAIFELNDDPVKTADNDYAGFVVEGREFLFKDELFLKLTADNSTGRQIYKGVISQKQFSRFLEFLKAKAKFQQ